MKQSIYILLFSLLAASLSAQTSSVRKKVREGNTAYKELRYGFAEEKYKEAVAENKETKEALFNLANTYYRQQRWNEALAEYQNYTALEQTNATKVSAAWSNIGNVYLKKKANEKSEKKLESNTQTTEAKGESEEKPDNLNLSMEAYKQALRLNPNDNDTRYNLAVVQKMILDQKGGGGNDNNKDKNKDKDKKDEKQDNKDNKQDKKQDPKNPNEISKDNIQQILDAIEQDEKATQERVQQTKAKQREQQNKNNKQQNKDW